MLTKTDILHCLQCTKRLWLEHNHPERAEKISDDARSRIEEGQKVGEMARTFFPGGVLIHQKERGKALAATKTVLSSGQTLFEAAFEAGDIYCRVDVLKKDNNACHLIEIKSSTKIKDEHKKDVAIQSWVLKNSGIPLGAVELGLINNQFVYAGNGNYNGLLKFEAPNKLVELESEVPNWRNQAQATLAGETEPIIATGGHCSKPHPCPFAAYCKQNQVGTFPPELLPHRSGKNLAEKLRQQGISDLRNADPNITKNKNLARILRATKSGLYELDPQAGVVINDFGFPLYYLDFETIQFAIPIWKGTNPYQQIPFQWSCHVETAPSSALVHHEFLADGNGDPRDAFAQSLVNALGTQGRILVYNEGMEKTRLLELAETFPDLKPALDKIIERLFDLLPLVRKNYYHPDMRGSSSIKHVLPTIDPTISYKNMAVGDGPQAQRAFKKLLRQDITDEERAQIRADLLAYCKLDTLATVKVAQFFRAQLTERPS